MITYDHLWWIKSTYDGWRRLKTLFWAVRASQPTKKSENKTLGVFFQAAFDFDAPGLHNTSQKSKDSTEKLNCKKSIFQKSVIFPLFIGILKPGSIKIERSMKKYFRGLILRLFGLMGSSLVPGTARKRGGARVWPPSPGRYRPSLGTNGHPIRPKNLRIRPQGYFFMLRSMMMLPGFEIPLKSEK